MRDAYGVHQVCLADEEHLLDGEKRRGVAPGAVKHKVSEYLIADGLKKTPTKLLT